MKARTVFEEDYHNSSDRRSRNTTRPDREIEDSIYVARKKKYQKNMALRGQATQRIPSQFASKLEFDAEELVLEYSPSIQFKKGAEKEYSPLKV